jgi:AraC-like DNA-binding protein
MSDTLAKRWDTEPTQRVAVLTCVPRLLTERGHRPEAVLGRLGIEDGLFEDPDRKIPYALVSAILAACSRATGIPHFGMLVGLQGDHRSLGRVGDVMACAPTLLDALNDFVSFQPANSRGAVVYLHRQGGNALLGYGIYDIATVAHDQIYGCVTALGLRLVHALTGGHVAPEEVWLTVRQPEDPTPYQAAFKCPVLFDQPATGLVLSQTAVATRLPAADPSRHAEMRAALHGLLAQSRNEWSSRVRHVLRPLLLLEAPTTERVAAKLGLTVRSLSRRLEKEGSSVGMILDHVRYAAARELLTVTRLSIGEISDALAYGQSSTFVTAFKRWSGTTPQAWRSARRAPDDRLAGVME